MLSIYDWKDMSGTITIEQCGREFVLNMYGEGKCNCFLAVVFETETEYQLKWFFLDEGNGKRMLGLAKCADGTKENYLTEVRKLMIYKKQCDNWKKIVTMFAQAFDNITIEIKEDIE